MGQQALPAPFGKYILLNKIAMGGMAEIFRAKTIGAEGFEKEVVIKRILPHYTEDESFVTMFIDEAKVSSGLNHPNIVQVYDFDKIGESYYIAMEYVEGKDLKRAMEWAVDQGEPLSVPHVVHLISEMCKGLHYAHTKTSKGKPLNIVHRDVSPHNVMVSYDGEVKVMDFGIAKAAARSTKTRAGTVKGKCAYMSPEQARGKAIDGRSDMFAVGVVMWEMLTNRRLFAGESDFETLSNVLKAEVPAPSSINDEVPPEIDDIVLRCLAKDRDDRQSDCKALMRELDQWFYDNVMDQESGDWGDLLRDIFAGDLVALEEMHAQDAQTDFVEVQEAMRSQRESSASNSAAVVAAVGNASDQHTVALDTSAAQSAIGTGTGVPINPATGRPLTHTGYQQQRGSSGWLYGVLAFVLLGFGVGAYWMFQKVSEQAEKQTASQATISAGTPTASPTPKTQASVVPSPPPKPVKQTAKVTFTVVPNDATITVPPDHKAQGKLEVTAGVGDVLSAVFEHPEYIRVVKRDIKVLNDGQTIAEVMEKKPKEEPKPVAAASAIVTVSVTPTNAKLAINGQAQTATSAGNYQVTGFKVGDTINVRVSNVGFLPTKDTLTLTQAQLTKSYALKKRPEAPKGPGTVMFNAKPWAKVTVKGKSCTTRCSMKLMSGRHTATFKQGSTTKRRGFKVKAGKKISVFADMTK